MKKNYLFLASLLITNYCLAICDTTLINKGTWSIQYFSSEEVNGEGTNNGKAIYAIDNDVNTYWHSEWKNNPASYPHTLEIDMGSVQNVNGISVLSRADNAGNKLVNYELYASIDGVNWGATKSEGILVYQNINLAGQVAKVYFQPTNAKYIKLVMKSNNQATQQIAIASLEAFKIVGDCNAPAIVMPRAPRNVDYTVFTSGSTGTDSLLVDTIYSMHSYKIHIQDSLFLNSISAGSQTDSVLTINPISKKVFYRSQNSFNTNTIFHTDTISTNNNSTNQIVIRDTLVGAGVDKIIYIDTVSIKKITVEQLNIKPLKSNPIKASDSLLIVDTETGNIYIREIKRVIAESNEQVYRIQYITTNANLDAGAAATVFTGISNSTISLPDPAILPNNAQIKITNIGDAIINFSNYVIKGSNGLVIDSLDSISGTNSITIIPTVDKTSYQCLAGFR